MKNVSVTLDDEVYEAGLTYARKRRLSLDRLLRQLLETTVRKAPPKSSCARFFALADQLHIRSDGHGWRREDLYRV
jgi:hypothetical protein